MPIKAKCRKCSKVYTVKDELAGKKFRCKECQAAVTVPQPAVILEEEPEPAEELFASNDFNSFGNDFGDDFGDDDYDYDEPAPPQRRKKKPAAKKKRKKKAPGSGIGAKVGTIFGGVFGFFLVLSIIFKVINAAGGLGALDLGTSWKPYTTPDGNVTILMPGTAKLVPVKGTSMAPGGQGYGVSKRNFACIIVIEPMTGELANLSEEEVFNAFEFGSGFVGAKNVSRTQINGRNGIKFETSGLGGIKADNVAFVHNNKMYTLNYAYKGIKGSKAEKYFNSVKFN